MTKLENTFKGLRLLGLPGLFCLWLCGARFCGRPLECVILWTVEIIRFCNIGMVRDIENIGLGWSWSFQSFHFMKFLWQTAFLNFLLMQNSVASQDKKASCRLTSAALFR